MVLGVQGRFYAEHFILDNDFKIVYYILVH